MRVYLRKVRLVFLFVFLPRCCFFSVVVYWYVKSRSLYAISSRRLCRASILVYVRIRIFILILSAYCSVFSIQCLVLTIKNHPPPHLHPSHSSIQHRPLYMRFVHVFVLADSLNCWVYQSYKV